MDQQQIDYLLKREFQERDAMKLSADPTAAEIHRQMADRYAELAQTVSKRAATQAVSG